MTPQQIQADVDRGIAIKAQLAELGEELKQITKRLEQAGLEGEQIPLQDPNREGRQYLATGSGVTVPVIFEADQLLGSVKEGSAEHQTLLSLIGDDHFAALWREKHVHERAARDGAAYRKDVRALFDARTAESIITASLALDKNGIPKSRTVIDWDRAKPAA